MNTDNWTEQDWLDAERCVAAAQATDKAYADKINNEVEHAAARFVEAGMSIVVARKLAERCVQNALYDIQTQLGGWNA